MTGEAWQQVKDLFEQARGLSPEQQRAFLDAECGPDGEVRREVEALLATPEPEEGFLETSPLAGGMLDRYIGRRLGAYEVIRRVGSGGTSTVYQAVRRDGQYEQSVAIKVVRAGMDRDFILRRLRTERQILAGLSHPGIAHLLDGGATEEGTPYLVMEFIDGVPVTEYCEHHGLSVRQRLAIFEQICAAVQHAHRNLIVHRDIKPGNVLVTADGAPKLLDFGIAKLLDAPTEAAASTRMMTPEYASPEQMTGGAITTSTDVYSLGVLLYEILSGNRPFRAQTDSPLEMVRLVCETNPEKPSTAAAGSPAAATRRGALEGDLDNIVLKAMRKEPERRYLSVEQFAGDVRRYLEGRPVLARRDTPLYRAGKFVRRNLAATVAAGLLVAAVAAGTGATLWQARVANRERARAERRFNEVRELARNTLFELDEAIRKLPGSTAARGLLCARAVGLLDGLAKDVSGDYGLQLELSEAYRRLSRVQGNMMASNLGDRAAAVASGRKALALAEGALAARPKDRKARRAISTSAYQIAAALSNDKERRGLIDRSIRVDEELIGEDPADNATTLSLAASHQLRGSIVAVENIQAALSDQQRSLELAQRLLDGGDGSRNTLETLSYAHKKVGAVMIKLDRLQEAAAHYGAALELDQRLVAMFPNEPEVRYALTFTLSDTGFIYGRQHDYRRATGYYLRVLDMREAMVREDPRDVRARHGVASTCNYLAFLARDQHQWKTAVRWRTRAIETIEALLRMAPGDVEEEAQRGWYYVSLGQDFLEGSQRPEAAERFRTAAQIAEDLKARDAGRADELRKAASEGLSKAAPER
jgi:eukaryotic-like serine/threonine-protein kinase